MNGLRYLTIMPILLMLVSATIGLNNYQEAKQEMRDDLTHALRQFVTSQSQLLQLRDTLPLLGHDRVVTLSDEEHLFGEQLTILPLKDTSHVAMCLLRHDSQASFKEEAQLCSDTLLWKPSSMESDDAVIAFKAYSNPSVCSILSHSDQRLPLMGSILCLLLLSGMAWMKRMPQEGTQEEALVPTVPQGRIHLTPMQEQLMEMFANAPEHTLSKTAICEALWPKKDHPENTLYTFISRLKSTLKEQSDLDIVNKRGKEYQLVEGDITN